HKPLAIAGDRTATGQGQYDDLVLSSVEGEPAAGRQLEDAEPGVAPAGGFGCDRKREHTVGGRAAADDGRRNGSSWSRPLDRSLRFTPLAGGRYCRGPVHSRATARSTAAATSPPGGYSSDRPMTRPRTVGSARAL